MRFLRLADLDTMTRYNRLFEIKIYHEFYDSFDVRDLSLFLLPETSQHIAGLQLICKKTAEGLIVLYNEHKKYLLEDLREACSFKFGISISNRFYVNFSKIPSRVSYHKHFLSNLAGTSLLDEDRADAEKHVRLHPGEWLSEETVNLTSSTSTKLQSLLGEDEVVISKEDETIFEGSIREADTGAGILNTGYGVYHYSQKDGVEVQKLHLLPDNLERAMAIIDITIDDTMNFDAVAGTCYYLRVASREVLSNYYFIKGEQSDFDSIEIISEKQKVEVKPPEKATLANGQAATKVVVTQPYLLKRKCEKIFMVEYKLPAMNEHDMTEKKKTNLPKPDSRKIKAKREGEAEIFFTDMYVYL